MFNDPKILERKYNINFVEADFDLNIKIEDFIRYEKENKLLEYNSRFIFDEDEKAITLEIEELIQNSEGDKLHRFYIFTKKGNYQFLYNIPLKNGEHIEGVYIISYLEAVDVDNKKYFPLKNGRLNITNMDNNFRLTNILYTTHNFERIIFNR